MILWGFLYDSEEEVGHLVKDIMGFPVWFLGRELGHLVNDIWDFLYGFWVGNWDTL